MSDRVLHVKRLGRLAYGEALAFQEKLRDARIANEAPDTLLLVEHNPVITLGRGAKKENLLFSPEALAEKGFELFETGRGGDVTYHGPGQLVGYPIVSLSPDRQDVRRYVRDLEETMIRTCADFGVTAERVQGFNGTWVGTSKIGAVGVRIVQWVTMHGFAINVTTDLSHFATIIPCGIRGRGVTSLALETGRDLTMSEVEARVVLNFAAAFGADYILEEGPDHLYRQSLDSALSST